MKIKIGVIIPDRGDRPDFLFQCWRMIKAQTLQPTQIELVNDAPLSDVADITWRYRQGYERLRGKGLDVIAFMENDDWYSPKYLETMAREWIASGKPDLFGTGYTIYFNLRVWKYVTMWHQDRASAMNTFIRPDMNFKWPADSERFTDIHLWMNCLEFRKKIWWPKEHIALGIKHGVGMCGGYMHVDRLERYDKAGKPDNGFLQSLVDTESFNFYKSIYDQYSTPQPVTPGTVTPNIAKVD